MDLTIVILAAGKGERLWPLTTTRPKPLLPILCKPLLDTHLETITSKTKSEIMLVMHHNKSLIEKHLKEQNISNKINLIDQEKPLGTGHAVKKALENIENDRTLVIYGDIMIGSNTYDVLMKELIDSDENIIVGAKVRDPSRYGVLIKNNDGSLSKIIEKPSEPYPSNLVFTGIMLANTNELKKTLYETRVSPRGEIELTDAIQKLAMRNKVIVKEIEVNEWIDVGTPWDYIEANKIQLHNKCRKLGYELENCVIGEKYNLDEPVVIEGPVFIGNDATIGPFSHIRGETVICENAKIGFATQVKASIILEGAKLPHLNYVGDSIIGEKTNLGAGTITANLRHDDKPVKTMLKGKLVSTGKRKFGTVIGGYSKTGINTSILPGVKIGAYAWIGSGCIIDRDVPDNTIVKCSQKKEITKKE